MGITLRAPRRWPPPHVEVGQQVVFVTRTRVGLANIRGTFRLSSRSVTASATNVERLAENVDGRATRLPKFLDEQQPRAPGGSVVEGVMEPSPVRWQPSPW